MPGLTRLTSATSVAQHGGVQAGARTGARGGGIDRRRRFGPGRLAQRQRHQFVGEGLRAVEGRELWVQHAAVEVAGPIASLRCERLTRPDTVAFRMLDGIR
jgi:hypothetical protein